MAEIVVNWKHLWQWVMALLKYDDYHYELTINIDHGQVGRYARLEDLGGLMKDSYVFVENVKSFPEKIRPRSDDPYFAVADS
ncbi:hypothetical protein J3R83DRAFT_10957 [Lanmaoa asiatica]|nr:hypothetical protein J3R83DRAFT_10957 [Lanmaoa asiatica]